MRRVRTSKAKRSAAVKRILRGESTPEIEAAKLHVRPVAIRAWVTMEQNGTSMGRKPGKAADRADEDSDSEQETRSARLDQALKAATLENGAAGDDAKEEAPPGGSVPPPDAAQLVAFVETLRAQALKLYCGVLGVDSRDAFVEEVLTFSKAERASLEVWAPYAAKYVPAIVGNDEKVGAWIFVGITASSLWNGMADLRRLAPKKKPREPEETFTGPGDPSSSVNRIADLPPA